MQFSIIYLLVAAAGIVVLTLAVRRRPDRIRPGLNYLLAGLICSSVLLLCQVVAYLVFGAWFMPPIAAIGIGFAMPGAMRFLV